MGWVTFIVKSKDFLLAGLVLIPSILLLIQGINKNTFFVIGLIYFFLTLIIFFVVIYNLETTIYNMILIKKEAKRNTKNANTAIIIANMNWLDVRDWYCSPFTYNFKDFFNLLNLYKKTNYVILTNLTLKKFDSIVYNRKIKYICLFGHGSKHYFSLNKDLNVYYCRYSGKKIKKDFVAQYHCNNGLGGSLADYIVTDKNKRKKCEIGDTFTNLLLINIKIRKMYRGAKKKAQDGFINEFCFSQHL